MTSLDTATRPAVRPDTGLLRDVAMRVARRWRLYRTRRVLSGLDARTLKDIGAPAVGGPAAAADMRVRRFLDTLR